MVDPHGHVAGNGESPLDGSCVEAREVPGGRGQGRGHPSRTTAAPRSEGVADGRGGSSTAGHTAGGVVWREGKSGHVGGDGLGGGEHGLGWVGATRRVVAGSIAGHGGSGSGVGLLQLLEAFLAVFAAQAHTPGTLLLTVASTPVLKPDLGGEKTSMVG